MTAGPSNMAGADERFPTKQLASLALCRLAEPVAFISIISYNFAMVRDIKGPENTALYAGLLMSAFGLAEACTAMFWGSLSDRWGRKPVILIGLMGTAFSSTVLGFARNYWVALLARVLGGLLNGNVAVMQTMIAEIVTNPAHEPRAYAIAPFMWSLGSIAGSALGGYAAQPARFYPKYFSKDGLFGRYPYLLPNLISVIAILLAAFQAAIFMKETNPRIVDPQPVEDPIDEVTERTPLRQGQPKNIPTTENLAPHYPSGRRRSYVVGSMPTDTEPAFDVRRSSIASIQSYKPQIHITASEFAVEEEEGEHSDTTSESSSAAAEPVFNRSVIMWTVAVTLMCYQQMAFMSAFPTFLLDTPRRPHGLDLQGGLGFTVHDVGRYMAVNSCASLFIQAVIFPVYVSKLGVWRSIVSLTIFCPLVSVMMPFITSFPRRDIALYFVFALQAFCTIIIYPSLLIMLKNATSSRAHLGKVNGMAISASSAARTIAPPLVGIIYSGLGSAAAWWSCAGIALFTVAELCFIPRPKGNEQEILRRASKVPTDDPTN